MPELCDAACQKIILDSSMAAVAAGFYQRIIGRTAGLTNADQEAPLLFIEASNAFKDAALFLNRQKGKLTAAEWKALMDNTDQNCYRASEYLIPWGQSPTITPAMAAAWTAKLFEWIQADQDFFVPLLQKLAGKKKE